MYLTRKEFQKEYLSIEFRLYFCEDHFDIDYFAYEMRGGVTYAMTSTCVQGGLRPLEGYQPNMLIEPSSPAPAWQYHSVIPKREPVDLERNDSGINSGSDCISSSPGSEHSETFNIPFSSPTSSTMASAVLPTSLYSPTIINGSHSSHVSQPKLMHMAYNNEPNPLTPPNCESLNEIETDPDTVSNTRTDTTLTPCASPAGENTQRLLEYNDDGPLRRLQLSLEKGGFLPQAALSPKLSECSAEDESKSDNDMDEYDEQGLRIPKVNSHGKVKTFKCKQCDFMAITKLDFWEHTKSHIKADKLLTCPKCPFVTEYKHHLEYHLRNHVGSKPFKCSQCSYSCVNKSMLNSHLKSHSNVYQYRCSDCSYATKYCHSLKLHLRKYSHKPAMVLNPDGTPNPLPIIDVYGTRRGPKVKNQEHKSLEDNLPKPEQVLPFPLTQFMLNCPPQLPFGGFPLFTGFPSAIANPLLLHSLNKLARKSQLSETEESSSEPMQNESGALDLSKPDESNQKNRYSINTFRQDANDNSSEEEKDDEEATTTMFSNVEVVEDKITEEVTNNNNKDDYSCQYCKINFGDPVLYTMHMGYHGYKNPFTCNMCGEECKDKVSFFLHIARTPHS